LKLVFWNGHSVLMGSCIINYCFKHPTSQCIIAFGDKAGFSTTLYLHICKIQQLGYSVSQELRFSILYLWLTAVLVADIKWPLCLNILIPSLHKLVFWYFTNKHIKSSNRLCKIQYRDDNWQSIILDLYMSTRNC